MKINAHWFSSETDEWYTPRDFYAKLNKKYSFTLDPCALDSSALCSKYFTPEDDGLIQSWDNEIVFMNPPYGRTIGKWMKKAYEAKGGIVVCLVPARTDTAWWHDYAMKGEIEFLRGRLKFGGNKHSAPFPSAVVVFK